LTSLIFTAFAKQGKKLSKLSIKTKKLCKLESKWWLEHL